MTKQGTTHSTTLSSPKSSKTITKNLQAKRKKEKKSRSKKGKKKLLRPAKTLISSTQNKHQTWIPWKRQSQRTDRQRGQVLRLARNHFSKQLLWKKWLQDNWLTSSSPSNPHKHTLQSSSFSPSTANPLLPLLDLLSANRNLNWVIEIILRLLSGNLRHPYSSTEEYSSSTFSGVTAEPLITPITWSTDLSMFLKRVTEMTVFITSTGSTPPSPGLGKLDSPIFSDSRCFLSSRKIGYVWVETVQQEKLVTEMRNKPP